MQAVHDASKQREQDENVGSSGVGRQPTERWILLAQMVLNKSNRRVVE
jgi:hypothetical protein